jgi:hypothetical protein
MILHLILYVNNRILEITAIGGGGKMRKKVLLLLIALIGLIISAPGVYADNISLGDTLYFSRGPGNGPGGEFIINDTTSNYQFNSFCVETNEFVSFGSPFKVGGISGEAVLGGSGGPHPDPLDPRTAYLYYHFRMGDLTGYDYGAAGRASSADQLQQAIWYIEQENLGVNNAFVALATTAVNTGQWSGLGPVQIINLQYPDGPPAQDQLVLVPEPSTLLLLGAGLLGLGILGRKKFKTRA